MLRWQWINPMVQCRRFMVGWSSGVGGTNFGGGRFIEWICSIWHVAVEDSRFRSGVVVDYGVNVVDFRGGSGRFSGRQFSVWRLKKESSIKMSYVSWKTKYKSILIDAPQIKEIISESWIRLNKEKRPVDFFKPISF